MVPEDEGTEYLPNMADELASLSRTHAEMIFQDNEEELKVFDEEMGQK